MLLHHPATEMQNGHELSSVIDENTCPFCRGIAASDCISSPPPLRRQSYDIFSAQVKKERKIFDAGERIKSWAQKFNYRKFLPSHFLRDA